MISLTAAQVLALALEIGFSPKVAGTLTCIAKHESAYRPWAHNQNKNGTADHGLLQINDIWFAPGVACAGLDPYRPSEALLCAKRILNERGFDAWVGYNKNRRECDEAGASAALLYRGTVDGVESEG